MYSGLSVFDLDGTLLTINSSFCFGKLLEPSGHQLLPPKWYCVWYYLCYQFCGMTLESLHEKAFVCLFKGRSQKEMQKRAEAFWEEEFQKVIYQPALECFKRAQASNHYTIILSSSPLFLVAPVAERLRAHACQATTYKVNEKGTFQEIDQIMEGHQKASITLELSHRFNLEPSSIFVYSDSYLDLPVLKIAGHAIGVKPDRHLRSICKEKKWEII